MKAWATKIVKKGGNGKGQGMVQSQHVISPKKKTLGRESSRRKLKTGKVTSVEELWGRLSEASVWDPARRAAGSNRLDMEALPESGRVYQEKGSVKEGRLKRGGRNNGGGGVCFRI